MDKATNTPPAYANGAYLWPACDEIRMERIDLSAFENMDQVQITFVAFGEWWSPFLIDDIHIVGAEGCDAPPPGSGTIPEGMYVGTDLVSGGTVDAPSEVIFKAGSRITLTEGFTVSAGAFFHALIEACDLAPPQAIKTISGFEKEENIPLLSNSIMKIAPNPFTGRTQIRYELEEEAPVSIDVFDVRGRRVAQPLKHQMHPAGEYQIAFDGSDKQAGMYIVVLQTPGEIVT